MSISIDAAGSALPTNVSAIKFLQTDETLVFGLGMAWLSIFDLTLGTVPQNFVGGDGKYSGPAVTFPLGPVTFGLQSDAGVSLALHTSGVLTTFHDGLDQPVERNVAIPAGVVYLALTLNFNISGNATFSYSGGAYGATAELDTTRTYAISFYKAFSPSKPVREAVASVFESFVLPLNQETFSHLAEDDYLLHEFDGNLHLAFGFYAGIDTVVYAGHSALDLSKTRLSPLAKFSVQAKPEIKASANLAFSLQYSSHFEALLSRSGGMGRLHLFRSSKRDVQTKLTAGMTVSLNASVALTATAPVTLQQDLVTAAGGAASVPGRAMSMVLTRTGVNDELQKYTADAIDKITAWTNKANDRQSNLELAVDSQSSRTVLAGYTLNLASENFDRAWELAYNGDLVAALETGAVTLDQGSGLEQEFQCKTSCSCNVFDLFKYQSWDQFSSNTSLVYAGHNTFHLVETVGHAGQSESVGALRSLNFYFTADADVPGTGTLSNANVILHLDATARADRKAIASMARLLNALGASFLARDLAAFGTNQKQGVAELNLTISPSAYGRIGFSTASTDLAADARNWQAFTAAADELAVWPLNPNGLLNTSVSSFFKSFSAWEQLNVTATGESTPDRTQIGNASAAWPEGFPSVTMPRALIVFSILAGQHFMNFCASLKKLADLNDGTTTDLLWTDLKKQLTDALKQESDVDFIRPAILAALRLCEMPPTITGPAPTTVPAEHFSVTISV